jgi:hypothetical protein
VSETPILCPCCGSELRLSAGGNGGECPICQDPLPPSVRAALADAAAQHAREIAPPVRDPAGAQANPAQARAIADAAVMRARRHLIERQPTPRASRATGVTVYHAPTPWVDPSGKLVAPIAPPAPTAPVSYGRPVYAAPAPTVVNPPQLALRPRAYIAARQITPAIATRTSKLAIASLSLGIIGLCSLLANLWFVYGAVSLLAVIIGHAALNRINRSARTLGGRGMAISGLVLGYLEIVLLLVLVVFALGSTPVK